MIKTKFYFTRSPLDFDYDVHITNGKKSIAQPLVFGPHDPTLVHRDPAMRMTQEELQGLFDALWHEGFRPARLEDSAAALGAVKNHLEDMRRLVPGLVRRDVVKISGAPEPEYPGGGMALRPGLATAAAAPCTCGTSAKCALHE